MKTRRVWQLLTFLAHIFLTLTDHQAIMRTGKCSHVRTVLLVRGGGLQRASELADRHTWNWKVPIWTGFVRPDCDWASVIEDEEAGLEAGVWAVTKTGSCCEDGNDDVWSEVDNASSAKYRSKELKALQEFIYSQLASDTGSKGF